MLMSSFIILLLMRSFFLYIVQVDHSMWDAKQYVYIIDDNHICIENEWLETPREGSNFNNMMHHGSIFAFVKSLK